MLKYLVVNHESGETREWEVDSTVEDAKKAHRAMRKIVREDLKTYPNSLIEVTVFSDDKKLESEFQGKADKYLTKNIKTDSLLELLKSDGIGEKLLNEYIAERLTMNEVRTMDWLIKVGWDPGEYGFSDVEVIDIATALDMEVNSAKGIIGSLTKKGLVYTMSMDGVDVIYAKDEGYQLDDEEKWGN